MKADEKSMVVGIIGAGSFGTAVANLLSANQQVLMYARRQDVVDEINTKQSIDGRKISSNITATRNPEELSSRCNLLFITIPSLAFREVVRLFSPFLRPDHIIIHCTKGLDLRGIDSSLDSSLPAISQGDILTMSQVIREETVVMRIGCLAGPNLASEINAGQPAASVIASHFDQVIHEGSQALKSNRFHVFGTHDLIGAELSGVFKNCIAIASGALTGIGLGENARAMLITKGLAEMIRIGDALGSSRDAFLGLPGIGDLVATCSSHSSRNFTVGMRLAKGEKIQDIINSMPEPAEGVRTVKIAKALADNLGFRLPIINVLYEIMFQKMSVDTGLQMLMRYPTTKDVDFL